MSADKHRNRFLRVFALANLPTAIPVKRTFAKGHWKRCRGTVNGTTGEHLVNGFVPVPQPNGRGGERKLVDVGPALRWLNKKGKLRHVRYHRSPGCGRTYLLESQ